MSPEYRRKLKAVPKVVKNTQINTQIDQLEKLAKQLLSESKKLEGTLNALEKMNLTNRVKAKTKKIY